MYLILKESNKHAYPELLCYEYFESKSCKMNTLQD
jgi:hypothetical protein